MQRSIERWRLMGIFPEIRPGAVFKTGDFVKQELGGGVTIERLSHNSPTMVGAGEQKPKHFLGLSGHGADIWTKRAYS